MWLVTKWLTIKVVIRKSKKILSAGIKLVDQSQNKL